MNNTWRCIHGCFAVALLLGISTSQGFCQSWDGSSNNRWSTSSNWTPSSVPNAVNATATLGAIVTGNTSIGLRGTRTVGTLNIQGSQNFTIFNGNGGTRELRFRVSSGSAAINISGSNSSEIASTVRVRLYDDTIITHSGTGEFTISGEIAENGSRSLTLNGTGTTVFAGSNSYSGSTTINGGVLRAENANALGTTGTGTTVNSGGSLALAGGITIADESLSLAGSGQGGQGALFNASGSNTFNGNISLSADATISSPNAGQTLTLGVSAADRTLVNNGHTLTVDGAGDTFFNSQISGTGGLIKNGTGTATLFYGNSSDPVLSSYSGPTTVNAGVLITDLGDDDNSPLTPLTGTITIGGAGQDATFRTQWFDNIGDATTVRVYDQGTLQIANEYNNSGFVETIGGLDLRGGSLVETINGASNPSTLALNGNVTHDGTGSTSATINGNLSLGGGTRDFQVQNGAAASELVVNAAISNGSLTKSGTGRLELAGSSANTYTGPTTVNGGTLELAKSSGVNAIAGSSITVNSGGTLLLGSSNQIVNSADLTLSGGTFSTGESVGFSETLGTLTLSGTSSINLGTASHLLQFADSSALSGSWSGALTIYGWNGIPYSSGTAGQIFFGNTSSSLTSGQLSMISFDGFGSGAILLTTGELVPVAVPGAPAVLSALLIAATIAYRERRTLKNLLTRLFLRTGLSQLSFGDCAARFWNRMVDLRQ